MMQDLERRVARAVRHFWKTRTRQRKHQGTRTGKRDSGNRTAATGGKQLDGFGKLVADLLEHFTIECSGSPAESTSFCCGTGVSPVGSQARRLCYN